MQTLQFGHFVTVIFDIKWSDRPVTSKLWAASTNLISNTAIPYSILDGPPLCIFKVTIYCSHLVSNIRFTLFLYLILDAYQACIRSYGYLRHLISNIWFTEVPIFDIRW
jgi:hypothetical protein